MATYLEIRQLFANDDLRNRITTATVIAANNFLSGTPTAEQKQWADAVFRDPDSVGRKVMMSVLATNSAASVAAITGATDATIQTNVNTVAQNFVDALAGV